MNPTLRRYLISSVTTFLTTFTGFFCVGLANIPAGQAFTTALILGVFGVAGRAAIKAVVEGITGHADSVAPVQ